MGQKWLKKTLLIIFITITAVIAFPLLNRFIFWAQPTAIEQSIVSVGNPFSEDGHRDRSLNVWDLQVFDGKLYIGGGSTVDNTGPINVWAYDLATQQFEQEYTVQEEAIEHFRVFQDQLYIPAADPTEGDANKFYYRDHEGGWHQVTDASIPLAHARDMIKLDTGEIILVGNSRDFKDLSNPGTVITLDHGETFHSAGIDYALRSEFNWFFSIFSYQGKTYAPTSLLKDYQDFPGTIAVFNPDSQKLELDPALSNSMFIPHEQLQRRWGKQGFYVIYRLWNPVEYNTALVYPVRSYSYYNRNYKQGYMNSIGCYVKPTPNSNPFAITLPDNRSIGEDVLKINNELYLLANTRVARNQFIIYVYKTDNPTDPKRWQTVMQFRSPNKARAFEYADGMFYFGLGQDYGDPIGKAGEILRLHWH